MNDARVVTMRPAGAPGRAERRLSELAGMPPALKGYIAAVCACAALVLGRALAGAGAIDPRALITLMLLSLLASVIKVEIAIPGSASTLTACHVIDLITLMLFGTNAAVLVAAWGGLTQCTLRSRLPNATHKTAFSVASLALTAWASGQLLEWMAGHADPGAASVQWESLAAAASMSFLVNSGLVAVALAVSTRRGYFSLWFEFFFSTWPSYVIGAVLAGAIIDGVRHQSYWLAPLLATALALVHRNHQSIAERIHDSMTDPLTGLHNQRFVSAHVERELARARRARCSVAMAVVDVDDFKTINDRDGHAGGDRALRRVADVLRTVVRDYDVCARYGGDEFVVVMTGCGERDATRRMEEAKRAIAATDAGAPLRISVGIAVFPLDGDRFETLFAAADTRMYRCKQAQAANVSPA